MLQVSHACRKSFHQDFILSSAVFSIVFSTLDGKFPFDVQRKKERKVSEQLHGLSQLVCATLWSYTAKTMQREYTILPRKIIYVL